VGAYSLHAQRDARETTSAGRAAFLARFEREVDPDGQLPGEERARRAEAAKKAHFTKMAIASARARRRRPVTTEDDGGEDVWEGFTGRLF